MEVSNEIDRLEIAVEAEANRANRALSGMEKRLNRIADAFEKIIPLSSAMDNMGEFNLSGFEKAEKAIDDIRESARKLGREKTTPKIDTSKLKYAVKPIKELQRMFRDSTFDMDFDSMDEKELTSILRRYEREYERLKQKLSDKVNLDIATGGNGELGGKEMYRLVMQMNQYENAIDRITEALGRMGAEQEKAFNPHIRRFDNSESTPRHTKAPRITKVLSESMNYNPEAMRMTFGEEAAKFRNFNDVLKKVSSNASLAGKKLNDFEDSIDTAKINTYEAQIRRLKTELGELAQKGFKQGDSEYDEKARDLARLVAEQKKYNKELRKSAEADVGLRNTEKSTRQLIPAMKSAANAAKKLSSSIGNGFKKAGAMVGNLTKQIFSVQRQANRGMSWGRMIGSSVLFSFVFQGISAIQNAIVEGSNNLVQYSNQYNATISSMVSALTYLKNAWAAAFAPIINVVGPYISSFVKMIATALNAIGTFFAALTGKGFVVKAKEVTQNYGTSLAKVGGNAGRAAKGIDDVADSAKDAAKEMQKTIFGFDQMNILNGPKMPGGGSGGSGGSGGGGGGAGGGGGSGLELTPSDMFETVPVEGAIADFAKNLREAFLKEDWEGLGEILASGINKGLQKLYDVINWDNVGPKITKFCNAFTTTFNSLVDNIDWDLMGRTLGAGFNTVVNTLYLLIDGIDWKNLGKKFGIGFMGLVDEVGWKKFGNLLGAKFMIGWDLFVGFIREIDGDDVGKALADAFNGIFEEIDGKDIGEGIGRAVDVIIDIFRSFVKNADWEEVGSDIWNGIKSAFKFASDEGKNDGIINALFAGLISAATIKLVIDLASAVSTLADTLKKVKDVTKAFGNSATETSKPVTSLGDKLKSLASKASFGAGWLTMTKEAINGVKVTAEEADYTVLLESLQDMGYNGKLAKGKMNELYRTMSAAMKKKVPFEDAMAYVRDELRKAGVSTEDFESALNKTLDDLGATAPDKAKYLGKGIGDGTNKGLAESRKKVEDASKGLGERIIEAFKNILGIHSPSTVFKKLAGFCGEGFVENLDNAFSGVSTFFSNLYEEKIKPWFTFEKWADLGKKAWDGLKSIFGGGKKEEKKKVKVDVELAKKGWKSLDDFVGKLKEKSVELAKKGWKSISQFVGDIEKKPFQLGKKGWSTISKFAGEIGTKSFALGKKSWSTVSKFVGEIGTKAFSLGKKAWSTVSNFVGEIGTKKFGLGKSGWSSLNSFVGKLSPISVSLKKTWSSLTRALGIGSVKLGIKLPRIGVKWSSSSIAGFNIKYPSGFYTYAKGGFPNVGEMFIAREKGPEMVGRIGRKNAVANNNQITSGIANAVAPAVYEAVVSAMNNGNNRGNGDLHVTIEIGGEKLITKIVNDYNKLKKSDPSFGFAY